MSDIQTCLTVFVVAACGNIADAKPMAIDAIDAYAATGPDDPTEAVRHLERLKEAYAKLKLDTPVAITIAAAIERRLSQLTEGVPSPDGALTDEIEYGANPPA